MLDPNRFRPIPRLLLLLLPFLPFLLSPPFPLLFLLPFFLSPHFLPFLPFLPFPLLLLSLPPQWKNQRHCYPPVLARLTAFDRWQRTRGGFLSLPSGWQPTSCRS